MQQEANVIGIKTRFLLSSDQQGKNINSYIKPKILN